MPPEAVPQKISQSQIDWQIAVQEREVGLAKTRLASEELKLAEMKLDIVKIHIQAEQQIQKDMAGQAI